MEGPQQQRQALGLAEEVQVQVNQLRTGQSNLPRQFLQQMIQHRITSVEQRYLFRQWTHQQELLQLQLRECREGAHVEQAPQEQGQRQPEPNINMLLYTHHVPVHVHIPVPVRTSTARASNASATFTSTFSTRGKRHQSPVTTVFTGACSNTGTAEGLGDLGGCCFMIPCRSWSWTWGEISDFGL